MKALILAGGLGLRLRSLVSDRPKPMALFNGRPFLAYQLAQLRGQGFSEVVVCAGYRAEQIQEYFGDGRDLGMRIDYAIERVPVGTGGAIKAAAAHLDGTFLVLNGDTYLDMDFRRLVEFHLARRCKDRSSLATLVAVPVQDAATYGSLHMEEDGTISGFDEKGQRGPGWVSGGAYVFEQRVIDYIGSDQMVSLEKTIFPLLLARRWRLYGWRLDSFFVDIGTPAGHHRFSRVADQMTEQGK